MVTCLTNAADTFDGKTLAVNFCRLQNPDDKSKSTNSKTLSMCWWTLMLSVIRFVRVLIFALWYGCIPLTITVQQVKQWKFISIFLGTETRQPNTCWWLILTVPLENMIYYSKFQIIAVSFINRDQSNLRNFVWHLTNVKIRQQLICLFVWIFFRRCQSPG